MKASDIFTKVLSRTPNTNTFDLSHDHKTSLNMGDLVPVLVQEVIPGDYWRIKSHSMLRFAPLVAPVMHSIDVFTHYWFVPNRILWDNWETFITGGSTGEENPAFPTIGIQMYGDDTPGDYNRLVDYMGIKQYDSEILSRPLEKIQVNAFPFAAYQMIWAEWYRDQTLIPLDDGTTDYSEYYKLEDGVNDTDVSNLFRLDQIQTRAWEHDYFTSCLPFAQRGEDVALPSELQGQVLPVGSFRGEGRGTRLVDATKGTPMIGLRGSALDTDSQGFTINPDSGEQIQFNNAGNSYVQLDNTLPENRVNIRELRTAIKLQEYLEKNARGGARYVEWLKNIFGVKSSDARLQRPEYIGGGKQNVVISEVLQTSETTAESPQANMSGHGISTGASRTAKYYAEEHGTIIGIVNVRPRSSYTQMTQRMWWKNNKFDFYTPQFAHIGEQEVYNKELMLTYDEEWNDQTFGYIPRYAEYRFAQSLTTGEMRRELDFWNLSRKFSYTPGERPSLNRQFIEMDNKNFSRIFADENDDYDKMYMHTFFQIKVKRRVAKYGTPAI